MKFVPSLNALRFIGALAVITTHLGSKAFLARHGLEGVYRLFNGSNGVILFYVLSGFLLTNLAISEIRNTGQFSLRKFYLRRALRLFPLYYLALFVLYSLSKSHVIQVSKTSYEYALLYAYNFVPKSEYSSNLGSFHTLGTEEQFYLFFGIVIFLVTVLFLKSWKFLIPIIFASLLLTLNHLRPLFVNYELTHFVSRWTFFAVQPILIGSLAAFVLRSPWFERKLGDESFRRKFSIGTLAGFFLFSFYVYKSVRDEQSANIFLGIGYMLLIISLVADETTLFARALSTRVLVYLGTISYGLYVWQAVFIGTGPHARWIGSTWIAVSLIFIFAMTTYRFYEKPFINWKKQLQL